MGLTGVAQRANGREERWLRDGGSGDLARQGLSRSLAGKVAVVRGAARGIGRSIAADFAVNGADVIGIDINRPVAPLTENAPAV